MELASLKLNDSPGLGKWGRKGCEQREIGICEMVNLRRNREKFIVV